MRSAEVDRQGVEGAVGDGRAEIVAHARRRGDLAGAVRATGGMTLLSRVGGLVRDVIVGRIFGDTAIGSAFAAGFAIPNTFRRLFGEGALTAAFIPAYAAARRAEPAQADALASLTVGVLGLVTGAITVVVEVALLAVLLLAPYDADRALSLKLIMVMLPFMPLICVVAILAGLLQVHGRFAAAASGPLVLNAFIVGVGAWCMGTGRLAGTGVAYALGAATVASGVTQCWWFLRLLRPHVRWTRGWGAARVEGRAVLSKFIPAALGLGTLQVNAYVDQLITMYPIWFGPTLAGREYPLDKASAIILALTTRLYQFPLGVFGIAIASAVFPLLARHAHEREHFVDTLRRGLRMSLFIGVPASVGLVLVRHEAVGVLFGHGKTGWRPESLERAGDVLLGFAVGVWAYSLNHVLTRGFYARGDTRTPMRVAVAMVGLNLGLNVVLIWWLREAGLAWATSTAAVVQAVVLAFLLGRRMGGEGDRKQETGDRGERRDESNECLVLSAEGGAPAVRGGHPVARERRGGLVDGEMGWGAARIVGASVVMGVCVWGVMWAIPVGVPEGFAGVGGVERFITPWVWQVGRLLAGCAVGGLVYLGAARGLGVVELGWLMQKGRSQERGR